MKVAGQEEKEVCRTEKLYGGMEAGILGGIHMMRFLWQQYAQEDDLWFFLIDL